MATREDVIACLKNIRAEIDAVTDGVTDEAWTTPTYEEGWNARQLLAHIASTSGTAGFVLMMAKTGGAGMPGDFDNDAFNRDQVAMRADKSVEDILNEVRSNIQRDVQQIEAAPVDLLGQHYAAPWGIEGEVAQVIIDSANGHLGGHIADLRAAFGR
jgi:uncharacterized protein (TIGR03083 family)